MLTKTPSPTAGLAVDPTQAPAHSSGRFAQTDGRPRRSQPLMRRYEVVHLLPNGDIADFTRIAPAHRSFESSFGVIARGGILKTNRGLMAIEDILPGDEVETIDSGFQPVLWRGAITLVPSTSEQLADIGKLIRVSQDSLGIGRPMSDLMLAPHARLLHKSPALQRVTGHDASFVPIADFVDGINIVELQPRTPVQAFQLGFDGHERFTVNGVEIDSQHPGARHELALRGDMLQLYLSLFPHKERLDQFGPLLRPRMSLIDLDFGNVA